MICSAKDILNIVPMKKKQATLEPLIKPRPMSAEKILKADVSLSPMVFDN